MDSACLKYCLTEEERCFFQDQGYLVIPDALDRHTAGRLIAAVDRIDRRERTLNHGADRLLSFTNFLPEDDGFVDLIDWPRTFPKVWGILGWNIYVYHTHLDTLPPRTTPPEHPYAWHQDSMRVNEELEFHPRPRLSLKVAFYLTDVSGPDWGNTLLLPASHFTDEMPNLDDSRSCPPGSVPLRVPAGSALLLDRRLWHSRSPNYGPHTRKVLWYGYAYRWLRPKDEMTVTHLLDRVDPIRRQLLGCGSSASSAYDPEETDVPLLTWLQEHQSDDSRWSPHHKIPQARPPLYGVRGKNSGRR